MSRLRLPLLFACAALVLGGGAAHANVYGYVDGGRVSVVISDTPPDDPRYTLFKKDMPVDATPVEKIAPSRYERHILAAAKETRVDPALIRAVIAIESGYNPVARSPAGAVGLMQLMPGTAGRYGVQDRLDPAQNIRAGARYLRDLKQLFNDDLSLVLAAYNAGEEAVKKHGRRIPPYAETAAYVPKVLDSYRRFLAAGL